MRAAEPEEQPERLRRDQEDGEVVRRDRDRGEDRPRGEPPAAAAQGMPEREDRRRAGEGEQRVGAGLLRVPDQERVRGDERGGGEARAARDERRARAVRDGDRRRAGERGERPEAHLAEPEGLAPDPRDEVVRVRGRLRARNLGERLTEAAVEERDRDELVQPEALGVERREPQHRAAEREGDEREPRGGAAHQPAAGRCDPRSPASAPRAVTMKSG
jgi:hypothetical protein